MGDFLLNDVTKKELKEINRQLRKSMKGSKGEADRLKKKSQLESDINGNQNVIDAAKDPATDLMKEKLKKSVED